MRAISWLLPLEDEADPDTTEIQLEFVPKARKFEGDSMYLRSYTNQEPKAELLRFEDDGFSIRYEKQKPFRSEGKFFYCNDSFIKVGKRFVNPQGKIDDTFSVIYAPHMNNWAAKGNLDSNAYFGKREGAE